MLEVGEEALAIGVLTVLEEAAKEAVLAKTAGTTNNPAKTVKSGLRNIKFCLKLRLGYEEYERKRREGMSRDRER